MSASDLEFIKSFCDRFVPVRVELDSAKGKYTKVPVISQWTSITPKEARAFEAGDWQHFMFVTGEISGLFVVDLDNKNPDRLDHEGKIDGIEFFEDWCGPVEAADTFTSRTIGGGCHKVYRYTQELDGKLKSGQLTPLALCDILFNGKGFTFGEGYQIINRMQPRPPPKSVINFIINHTHNNLLNMGGTDQQMSNSCAKFTTPIKECFCTTGVWTTIVWTFVGIVGSSLSLISSNTSLSSNVRSWITISGGVMGIVGNAISSFTGHYTPQGRPIVQHER